MRNRMMAKRGVNNRKQLERQESAASSKLSAALKHVEQELDAEEESDSADSFLEEESRIEQKGDKPEDRKENADVDEFGFLMSAGNGDQSDSSAPGNFEREEDNLSTPVSKQLESGDSEESEDHPELTNLVQAISAAAKKRAEEESRSNLRKRKQFGLLLAHSSSDDEMSEQSKSSKKITLDDIRASTSSAFGVRSLSRLEDLERHSSSRSEVVKSRLGRRLEERVDRTAAYEFAKDEVKKWVPTVQEIRQADHLEFPLLQTLDASRVAGTGAPMNDDAELEGEELINNLQEKKINIEDLAARRNELRRMRELMFREEMKARRVKKIKSKTYRRIRKREREHAEAVRSQLEDDSAPNENEYEQAVNRARERMSLKHKNSSKWARDVKKIGLNKDRNMRQELEEMLIRGEELTQKINGGPSDSSGDDGDLESEDEDERLDTELSGKKGIMNMKFMQVADEAIRNSRQQDIDEIRRANEDGVLYSDETEDSAIQVINSGRRKYAPGAQDAIDALNQTVEASNQAETAPTTMQKKLSKLQLNSVQIRNEKFNSVQDDDDQKSKPENPWILDSTSNSISRGGALVSLSKDSTRDQKSQSRLKKLQKSVRSNTNVFSNKTSVDVQIDVNQILEPRDINDEEYERNNEIEVSDTQVSLISANMRRGHSGSAIEFEQRELVKKAFAGDDVVRDFEQEKQSVIDDEGDKEVDVTLPGWGSWTGTGTKKSSKRFVNKISGINAKDRKDAKLKKVIINERTLKKSAKYMTGQVPYPYETKEQYERAMKLPMGKEWSTQSTIQQLTKPKVIVKPGIVVEPINAPFS
ncbi:small-subunit processome [Lipomyces oligophaga]|uniref:small-subunit processome n=1 Tax=Lipomyces oligophaga TaxID=45792 RepID=UPI0034CEB8EE